MSNRVQPGVKIDRAVWDEFRQSVQDRKGGIRGHLRSELETALRLYIGDESEVSSVQVNRRLARIESELGVAGTDGGTDTFEQPEHTHAPGWSKGDEKPSANAPTDKKVAYLAECVLDSEVPNSRELISIPRASIVETVKDEYGFRSDTAKRYVEHLIDEFDLRQHPTADPLLVSDDRYREIVEQEREQRRDEAEAELSDL